VAVAMVVGAVATAGGCSTPRQATTTFDLSRVEVRLDFEPGTEGSGTVVAEFRPSEADIHLYALEMPDGGIDGIGKPTRVNVVDGDWTATGSATASARSTLLRYPGLAGEFPAYPDGPVTVRVPVVRRSAADDGWIDVALTFLPCTSSGLCYAPVVDQPMRVATR
jgi:hypothetical protein